MIDKLIEICQGFWFTLAEMSPYLLFGFLVAGIMSVFISPKLIETHLGGRGIWPIIKASLFGVPLPLCSCGVIPVTVSLREHGASRGSAISFLLSTPQTGIDSLFVTYAMLGPVFTVFRPIIAFVTGIIGGVAVETFDPTVNTAGSDNRQGDSKDDSQCQKSCCKKTEDGKLIRLLKYGFLSLPKDIGGAMLIGIVIAALIGVFVPDDYVIKGVDTLGAFGTMVVMMFLGIPVYVCATASVPVAAVMMTKGISPGAVLVFLMTGPATNAAAFATIWKAMGGRTALVYILTVIGCALGAGLLLDYIFPYLVTETQHLHEMTPPIYKHIAAIILLLILIKGIYEKNKKSKP